MNTAVDSSNILETTTPIARVSTSALSAPDHQKCTQKELKALLHVARYGTKVQVRVCETVHRTSSDDLPASRNNRSETDQSTNQQIETSTSFKWKTGRICQITSDTVFVRFPNGIDIRVPWVNRDVKLFRHTPLYHSNNFRENETHEEHIMNDHSNVGENDISNLSWNNNYSSSRVEPDPASSSSSAATDFLLQNFDSDSEDERYNGSGRDDESRRVLDSLSAAFHDFSEFTDRDEEVERGLESCGVAGMSGTEGQAGGHEGLLGLESLLLQYQGERGNEDAERGSEFLRNGVQGYEGGSVGLGSEQGPTKRRIVSFASSSSLIGNDNDRDSDDVQYVPGHDVLAEQAKALEENERKEALCRQQDEDDYFRRLNVHCARNATRFLPGSFTFDYAEQKEIIETRRTLALLGISNPEDVQEDEEEDRDPMMEVERAGFLLDPEEDPTIAVLPPDACVYGRLGKVSDNRLCDGDCIHDDNNRLSDLCYM